MKPEKKTRVDAFVESCKNNKWISIIIILGITISALSTVIESGDKIRLFLGFQGHGISEPPNGHAAETGEAYCGLDSVLETLPRGNLQVKFKENVFLKAFDNLPAMNVEELITVFFEPSPTAGSTNSMKIQQLRFSRQTAGKIQLRGRTTGSTFSDTPKLFTYHCRASGALVAKELYQTLPTHYDFEIEPGDTVTFIAKYPCGVVTGEYDQGHRDWNAVEVSDLAPLSGVNYRFYAGAVEYHIGFVGDELYDFYPWTRNGNNEVRFQHRKWGAYGSLSESKDYLQKTLSPVLKMAGDDIEKDLRYKGAIQFLLNGGFSKVEWAVDETRGQKRDVAYITETKP